MIDRGYRLNRRHEEDGVQDTSVAREVLQLLRVPHADRHQVLHPQGAGDLLHRLLRGDLCYEVHQVQQGQPISICSSFFILSSKNLCDRLQ